MLQKVIWYYEQKTGATTTAIIGPTKVHLREGGSRVTLCGARLPFARRHHHLSLEPSPLDQDCQRCGSKLRKLRTGRVR